MQQIALHYFTKHREFVLYCAIGIMGIAVEMSTFWVLFSILGADKFVANALSTFTSVTHNFLINTYFNFRTRNHIFRRYVSYLGVSLVGLAISSIVLLVGVDLLQLNTYVMKVVSIVAVVFTQFYLNTHITYRNYQQLHLSKVS